jgi:glycerol-3-phosphate O-acyltransferase
MNKLKRRRQVQQLHELQNLGAEFLKTDNDIVKPESYPIDDIKQELLQLYPKHKKIVVDLIADLSSAFVFRALETTLDTFLMRMYQEIHMNFKQIEPIINDCRKHKIPIVFLPCHKSHIDYIVISYMLYK